MIAFNRVSEHDGYEHWRAIDGSYSIVRYVYWHPYGETCGPEHRCDPYWRAYDGYTGASLLADKNGKLESMAEAILMCRKDAGEIE